MNLTTAKNAPTVFKVPPHNDEAECQVLGSLLIDKNAIHRITDIISLGDFYDPRHERVFRVIYDLFTKGSPIDIVSVSSRLSESQELAGLGGASFLTELVNGVSTASHIEHYASIVRAKKLLRDLITLAGESSETAFTADDDIDLILDSIEQKVIRISQRSVVQRFVGLREELQSAYDRIAKLHQKGGSSLRGIASGFTALDNILSGFQKSDLIILGARPSVGKTSLALDIARQAAFESKVPVGIFSLEMSRDQIVERLISSESGIPLWRLRTGRINDDLEFQMIQQGLDRLSNSHIFIDDSPSPTVLQIRSLARRLQLEHGLGLILVDYLQLVAHRTRSDNVVQQISEISHGLKALARELSVPVIAVSQLSRSVEQRDTRLPRLSDLRDSGSIEQDADVVLFIYRKDKDRQDLPEEEQGIADIIIAKHRNGPTGVIKLKFDQERASFKNIDKAHATDDVF